MNVTLITPDGVDKRGRERSQPALLWLIERLSREHRVLVIALQQYPEFTHYHLLGAEVVNLGQVRGLAPERLTRLCQLRQAFRLTQHRPELIHALSLGEAGLLAAAAGQWWRVPVLGSLSDEDVISWPGDVSVPSATSRSESLNNKTIKKISQITYGSRYALDQLAALSGKQPASGHWLPLGVDTRQFKIKPRQLAPPWRFLQVAPLDARNDQSMLLRAMCHLVAAGLDFHLDVVGQDRLRGRIQIESRVFNLAERVHFHGDKANKRIPFYHQAHLFLQSALHENQGVALLEAAATGLPTVGTAVGLLPELAPTAAVATPPGDDIALAEAILALVGDKGRWEKLSAAAAAFATTYNADWTATQFSRLYGQLAGRNRSLG